MAWLNWWTKTKEYLTNISTSLSRRSRVCFDNLETDRSTHLLQHYLGMATHRDQARKFHESAFRALSGECDAAAGERIRRDGEPSLEPN